MTSRVQTLSPPQLEAIRRFDTCTIANAIEQFGIRLRNEGFTRPGLFCVTGGGNLFGYAFTSMVRSANPLSAIGANMWDKRSRRLSAAETWFIAEGRRQDRPFHWLLICNRKVAAV